jgi:hypothetical protein
MIGGNRRAGGGTSIIVPFGEMRATEGGRPYNALCRARRPGAPSELAARYGRQNAAPAIVPQLSIVNCSLSIDTAPTTLFRKEGGRRRRTGVLTVGRDAPGAPPKQTPAPPQTHGRQNAAPTAFHRAGRNPQSLRDSSFGKGALRGGTQCLLSQKEVARAARRRIIPQLSIVNCSLSIDTAPTKPSLEKRVAAAGGRVF